MPASLISGPRTVGGLSKDQSDLIRGPNRNRKLFVAPWSNTWPAPGTTLDIDFVNDRSWIKGIGQTKSIGGISYTRPTNATYVDRDGLLKTTLTYDRDNTSSYVKTTNSLISPNLLFYSEDFTNSYWAKNDVTITANTTNSPFGTNDASKVTANTTNTEHTIGGNNNSATITLAGNYYILSAYVKPAGYSCVSLLMKRGSISEGFVFDLVTKKSRNVLVAGSSNNTLFPNIETLSDGWFRVSFIHYSISAFFPAIGPVDTLSVGASNPIFVGDGSSGIFLYGVQLENVGSAILNVPRFDWTSTTTLANKNLLTYTNLFPGWTPNGSATLTKYDGLDPDGGNNAVKFTGNTNAYALILMPTGLTWIPNTTYTISFWAKGEVGGEKLRFSNSQTGNFFDAVDVTLTTSWQKFVLTGTTGNYTATNIYFETGLYVSQTTANIIYLYQPQLELGSSATEYQPISFSTTNLPLAANTSVNGFLIEEARTNRILWCRDPTNGNGTNMIRGSSTSVPFFASNGTIGILGNELVANGDFSSSVGWSVPAGWIIQDGVASCNTASGYASISRNISVSAGKIYRVQLDLTSRTSGATSIYIGNSGSDAASVFNSQISTVGSYSTIVICPTGEASQILIRSENGFVGSVDNVSVKEITADGVNSPNNTSTAATATASSANATFLYTARMTTGFASTYTFSVWLKRKTGTGNIDLTCNSGQTWVTQNITSSWERYSVTQSVTAVSPGIRIVTSGDEVEVWGPQLVPGSILTEYQTTTINAEYGWCKINVATTKDQTGIDGVVNTATRVTAIANNGILFQPVSLASGGRASSVFLKRITGSGTIQITLDGNNWSSVDISNSQWRRLILSGTVTNPAIGIKLFTNGDEVAIDYAQVEDGTGVTSPILTTSSMATRAKDTPFVYNFDSWWNRTYGSFYFDFTMYGNTQYMMEFRGNTRPPSMTVGAFQWGRTNYTTWSSSMSGIVGWGNTNGKYTYTFDTINLTQVRNGSIIARTSGTNASEYPVPYMTNLLLADPNNLMNGYFWLKRFVYYPKKLTDFGVLLI